MDNFELSNIVNALNNLVEINGNISSNLCQIDELDKINSYLSDLIQNLEFLNDEVSKK